MPPEPPVPLAVRADGDPGVRERGRGLLEDAGFRLVERGALLTVRWTGVARPWEVVVKSGKRTIRGEVKRVVAATHRHLVRIPSVAIDGDLGRETLRRVDRALRYLPADTELRELLAPAAVEWCAGRVMDDVDGDGAVAVGEAVAAARALLALPWGSSLERERARAALVWAIAVQPDDDLRERWLGLLGATRDAHTVQLRGPSGPRPTPGPTFVGRPDALGGMLVVRSPGLAVLLRAAWRGLIP